MANPEHVDLLKQGRDTWNTWRRNNPTVRPDLTGADLNKIDLSDVNLCLADLSGTNLNGASLFNTNLASACLVNAYLIDVHLVNACLIGADLTNARLIMANLSYARLWYADLRLTNLSHANLLSADLRFAKLNKVDLSFANLSFADLSEADLISVDLRFTMLVRTNLVKSTLTDCLVHGTAVWNVELKEATQKNLIITTVTEPTITVDNLEVAQFIYLLLNNSKIRDVIDTVAKKAVLILGRFPDARKMILESLKDELGNQNYLPIVFNFEQTDNRDFTETVRTLANMARFVLIDLTDLDETIREIASEIVPHCVVPIRPLLLQGSHRQEYELVRELQYKYRWVLAPYRYKDLSDLQSSFQEQIIQPINEKIIELKQKKPLKIFIGYAPEDKKYLNKLKTYLRIVERSGLIEIWDDQDVTPGEETGKQIERHLSDARIILLLISPAFLDSDDCYDIQMSMALERYEQGEARVIPILLRPCAWQLTPLKELLPLPRDGKPISERNRNNVFFEVSEEIGEVIKILR